MAADAFNNLDWREWVERYDRMQERYLVGRAERFDVITRLVRVTQAEPITILDLGCGTGSLSLTLLNACPSSFVYGLDLDSTLLPLAEARTSQCPARAHFVRADLRDASWVGLIPKPVDAVVSATALHWLSEQQLGNLYDQVGGILKPGGIFLNADHVASESPAIQQSWWERRGLMREADGPKDAEDWDGFWRNFLAAMGPEAAESRKRALGAWQGIEEGLPLAWHLDRLRAAGFSAVDCFWRSDCDAVYGGLKSQ